MATQKNAYYTNADRQPVQSTEGVDVTPTGVAPILGEDDDELIRSAQNGMLDAFTVLYERYLPVVYRRVCYVIPEDDVDDVTQEVFIAAMKSLQSFRFEAQFRTWLRTLVNRQVADYYRRRNPRNETLTDLMDGDVERYPTLGTSVEAQGIDERIVLRQGLRRIPDNYREILLMRFADGLQFNEIARLQHQSLEATKSLFRRAVAALQKQVTYE